MAAWIHKGLEEFNQGRFDNGGDNLYCNADGVIYVNHSLNARWWRQCLTQKPSMNYHERFRANLSRIIDVAKGVVL